MFQRARMRDKSLFILRAFVVFVLLFWLLIVLGAPVIHMRDFWTTPMRALIYARSTCDGWKECFEGFVKYSGHNDSVKLFPGLLELAHTSIVGSWSIVGSRIIGTSCWLLTFFLLLKAHNRLSPVPSIVNKTLYLSWLFIFTMFISVDRFSAPFAIHRALPSLCVVSTAFLLWVPLNRKLQSIRMLLVGIFSFISLFSFAYGFWLFILSAATFVWKKSNYVIWFIGFSVASLVIYFNSLSLKHSSIMAERVTPSLAKGLVFLGDFSTWPATAVFEGSFAESLAYAFVAIVVAMAILSYLLLRKRFGVELSEANFYNGIGFYVFIVLAYLPVPVLVTLQRGYSSMPPRYFVESSMFCAGLAGLLALVIIRFKMEWLSLPFLLASVGLLALNIYRLIGADQYLSKRYFGGRFSTTVECLKRAPEINVQVAKECELDKECWRWRNYEEKDDKAGLDRYVVGLNAVLGSKK